MIDEELAEWWPLADLIQEAVYSGYVKAHVIKVLIVLFPNGITGYLYGPISGYENDITAMYYALFSDSIFPYHACITHHHRPPLHGVLPERLKMENFATNSICVSIGWTYGDVIVLFHVLHSHYQKKYCLPDRLINQVIHNLILIN